MGSGCRAPPPADRQLSDTARIVTILDRGFGVNTRRRSGTRRWLGLAAVAASVALVLSACGSDSKSSDSTTTKGGSSTTASGGAADAKSTASALEKRPTEITNTTPITGTIPKGKTVAWIQCPTPACVQLGKPMQQAAEALGWTLKIITQQGTPESVKQAYQQAISANVDAVVGSGFPRAVYEDELQQLKAKDVPVVQITVTDPPTDGISAVVNGPGRNAQVGAQIAASIASRNTKANVLWVTAPYPILEPELKGDNGTGGFEPTLKSYCSDCKVATLDIPADAVGKDAPARIVAYLQANPDVNEVVGAFGDLVGGLPGALQDAGLEGKVKITTYTQNPALSAALENGEVQAVIGFPGPENTWQAIDTFARIWAGDDYVKEFNDLPSWIITKGNVPSTTEDYPLVENYQAQYKKLWGLG